MKKRFLDTSQAIALGWDGTSSLGYEPVVTSYGKEEMIRHGIDVSTQSVFSPSWPDLGKPIDSGNWGQYYEWVDSSNGKLLQVYHYVRPFGPKAPCGCDATGQIFYEGQVYFFCESLANSEIDFSYLTGTISNPEILPPDTRDSCLGKTCKFYHYDKKKST